MIAEWPDCPRCKSARYYPTGRCANDKCYDNLTPLQKVFAQVWLAYTNDVLLDNVRLHRILKESGMAKMRPATESEAREWNRTAGNAMLFPTAEGADILRRVP